MGPSLEAAAHVSMAERAPEAFQPIVSLKRSPATSGVGLVFSYRTQFPLAFIPEDGIALLVAATDHPYRLFCNGTLVGQWGVLEAGTASANYKSNEIILAPAALRFGPNVLVLQIFPRFGGLGPPHIYSGEYAAVAREAGIQTLLNSTVLVAAMLAGLGLAVLFLSFWSVGKFQERIYLLFALSSLTFGLGYLNVALAIPGFPELWVARIARSSLGLSAIFILHFVLEFVHWSWGRRPLLVGFYGLAAFAIVGISLSVDRSGIDEVFSLFASFGAMPAVLVASIIVLISSIREQTPLRLLVLVGTLATMLAAAHDLYYLTASEYPYCWVLPYGFMLLQLSAMGVIALERLHLGRRLQHRQIELEEALAAMRKADQAKAGFLANIAHEFRTPLHGVMGGVELLQRRLPPSEDTAGLVDGIAASLGRFQLLMENARDWVDLHEGRLALSQAPFDFHGLLEEVRVTLQDLALQEKVELRFEVEAGFEALRLGDAARLRQLLGSLLQDVLLGVGKGLVRVQVSSAPGRVRIAVWDEGATTDPALAQSMPGRGLWTVGDRMDPLGVGVGWGVCQGLVRAMTGTIQTGNGSEISPRFVVELPLEVVSSAAQLPKELPVKSTTAPERTSAESGSGPRTEDWREARELDPSLDAKPPEGAGGRIPRILVVEDNEMNGRVVCSLIRTIGFEVLMATDGSEGLQMALRERPDIILMDVQMPIMDGLEATRRLRLEEARFHGAMKRIPVLGLTANAGMQECLDAGMDDWLGKPIRLVELEKAIRKWLVVWMVKLLCPSKRGMTW